MKSCQKCKTDKDCSGRFYIVETNKIKEEVEFYTYQEIRNCVYQVKWIITNAELLESGRWPAEPKSSGYIEWKEKGFASEAYFVKPVVTVAEVNKRLRRAGLYGKLLRAEVLAELELSDESKTALRYVRGERRKKQSFRRWMRYKGRRWNDF
uniref:Uncharacterized protein n=1 Tax=viral metagenome TaxID=1070528 RepID=A0A6M3KV79_9ZZZZ